jgi:hypothetical protein
MLQLDQTSASSEALSASTVSEQRRAEVEAAMRKFRQANLPGIVDWIDPILLCAVPVRTLISSTIGQDADQRPMQAAIEK